MLRVTIPYRPRYPQGEIHAVLERTRFAVLVAHRRMGKTVLAVNHLLRQAVRTRRERACFAYVAPFRNQAKSVAWSYLKHYSAPVPGRTVNEQELGIVLPNGAGVRLFGADNPDALRGLYFDGVVLDEVAQMKPETWGEIIRPALSDRKGWAVFIGTPKGRNLFEELYRRAQSLQGKGDPDWAALCYRADQTGALDPGELEKLRREMEPNAFAQEFLCDFAAGDEDSFISAELAGDAARREAVFDSWSAFPRILGVDVARGERDRGAMALRQGALLVSVETVREPDLMRFASIVARKQGESGAACVFVDGVGMGAGVADRLRELGVPVVDAQAASRALQPERYANRRAEMWARMKEWLRTASIPNDDALIADLTGLRYSFTERDLLQLESKKEARARGLPSPDLADAVALTFYDHVAAPPPARRKAEFAAGWVPPWQR